MTKENENTKSERIKIKIDGDAFSRLKKADSEFQASVNDAKEAMKSYENKLKEAHDIFWGTVYKEAGISDDDQEKSFHINTEYGDLGFYILEEKKRDCCKTIEGALKSMLATEEEA
jgi:hypothetical protein